MFLTLFLAVGCADTSATSDAYDHTDLPAPTVVMSVARTYGGAYRVAVSDGFDRTLLAAAQPEAEHDHAMGLAGALLAYGGSEDNYTITAAEFDGSYRTLSLSTPEGSFDVTVRAGEAVGRRDYAVAALGAGNLIVDDLTDLCGLDLFEGRGWSGVAIHDADMAVFLSPSLEHARTELAERGRLIVANIEDKSRWIEGEHGPELVTATGEVLLSVTESVPAHLHEAAVEFARAKVRDATRCPWREGEADDTMN